MSTRRGGVQRAGQACKCRLIYGLCAEVEEEALHAIREEDDLIEGCLRDLDIDISDRCVCQECRLPGVFALLRPVDALPNASFRVMDERCAIPDMHKCALLGTANRKDERGREVTGFGISAHRQLSDFILHLREHFPDVGIGRDARICDEPFVDAYDEPPDGVLGSDISKGCASGTITGNRDKEISVRTG